MIKVCGFAIDASDKCYMVGKLGYLTDKKTGEKTPYIIAPTYPSSLQNALRTIKESMRREAVKETDLVSIDAAIDILLKSDESLERELAKIDM